MSFDDKRSQKASSWVLLADLKVRAPLLIPAQAGALWQTQASVDEMLGAAGFDVDDIGQSV